MPKKQKIDEVAELPVEKTAAVVNAVKVVVVRSHCITPHSIELRKDESGLVVDARTEDWRHIQTIGAKTVEDIFREVGVEIPADDDTELEIIISPYTGEVMAIQIGTSR